MGGWPTAMSRIFVGIGTHICPSANLTHTSESLYKLFTVYQVTVISTGVQAVFLLAKSIDSSAM
jgi:hypothetical protein